MRAIQGVYDNGRVILDKQAPIKKERLLLYEKERDEYYHDQ